MSGQGRGAVRLWAGVRHDASVHDAGRHHAGRDSAGWQLVAGGLVGCWSASQLGRPAGRQASPGRLGRQAGEHAAPRGLLAC